MAAIRSGCRLGYSYNQPLGQRICDQNRLPLMLASAGPLASAPSNAPPEPDGLKPRGLKKHRRPKKTEQIEQDPAVWLSGAGLRYRV